MGKHFALIVLAACCLSITACNVSSHNQQVDWFGYQNTTLGYSLSVPQAALTAWKGEKPIDGPETGFGTYRPLTQPQKDDYSIIVRNPSTECSVSITGVSHASTPSDGTSWGKVDAWDHLNFESGDDPYAGLEKVICRKDGTPPPTSVYALCSEKDGKTIVICISQMTDNPQLAEDIFKTFKWTK